jgi:hypothetical protein
LVDAADFDCVGELFSEATLLDPEGREIARGPGAVADFYRRTVVLYDGSPRTEHVTGDPVIKVDEEAGTATSESTYVVHLDIDGQRVRVAAGRYSDRFARADGRWRFTQRQFFLDETREISKHVRMPESWST